MVLMDYLDLVHPADFQALARELLALADRVEQLAERLDALRRLPQTYYSDAGWELRRHGFLLDRELAQIAHAEDRTPIAFVAEGVLNLARRLERAESLLAELRD